MMSLGMFIAAEAFTILVFYIFIRIQACGIINTAASIVEIHASMGIDSKSTAAQIRALY